MAKSNDTPCFSKLLCAFSGAHSNLKLSTNKCYYKIVVASIREIQVRHDQALRQGQNPFTFPEPRSVLRPSRHLKVGEIEDELSPGGQFVAVVFVQFAEIEVVGHVGEGPVLDEVFHKALSLGAELLENGVVVPVKLEGYNPEPVAKLLIEGGGNFDPLLLEVDLSAAVESEHVAV